MCIVVWFVVLCVVVVWFDKGVVLYLVFVGVLGVGVICVLFDFVFLFEWVCMILCELGV